MLQSKPLHTAIAASAPTHSFGHPEWGQPRLQSTFTHSPTHMPPPTYDQPQHTCWSFGTSPAG